MILVSGASGLLGVNFVKKLTSLGVDTVALHNSTPIITQGLKSVKADIRNQDLIKRIIKEYKPSWIVHCAAQTNVDWCEKNPSTTWAINAQATGELAKQAELIKAGFIYISTDSVFDGLEGNYKEHEAVNPLNVYASSKLAGERAVEKNHKRSVILRTNIYGWSLQYKLSLVEWIIERFKANQTITGFSDVYFSPIMVTDLCDIITSIINQRLYGLYHAVSSGSCSKYCFAKLVGEVFGYNQDLVVPISVKSLSLIASRPTNTTLNNTKLSGELCEVIPDVKTGLFKLKTLFDNGYINELKQMEGS